MDSIEFIQRLQQSEPGSPEAAALAHDLVEDARYPAMLVLQRYLSSDNEDDQMKAKNVLADLREWALVPLAESTPYSNIDTEVWVMRSISDESFALRRRVASLLEGLLENGRPALPPPDGSLPFEFHADTRVCDVAFILLSSILHLESPSSAFLAMPRSGRDKRIKELKQSPDYRATFED